MALVWLPDNSGFVSGGMDRKIVIWVRVHLTALFILLRTRPTLQDADGTKRDSWGPIPVRIEDLAVTPDQTRLVVVGLNRISESTSYHDATTSGPSNVSPNISRNEHRMIIFDLINRREDK